MKYIFFGTPEFAATILETLITSGMKPELVVTAPDKPAGRKNIVTPPPAKLTAQKHDTPLLQPETLKEETFIHTLKAAGADVGILAAYGKIIPKTLLDLFPKGIINVHPSLLPRWRGASPIQYAILNGDQKTGVSIMLLDEEMDHGPVLAAREYPNSNTQIPMSDITAPELQEQLATMGANLLVETAPRWVAENIEPREQDHSRATYTKLIKKEDGCIDWNKSAEEIERMVRAFHPWPGAFTFWKRSGKEQKITILEATPLASKDADPGTVFLIDKKTPAVACGTGALMIKKLQLAGKNAVPAEDFLNGYPDIVDVVLR